MNDWHQGTSPPVDVLVDRAAVLERLVVEPGHVRDLVDETDRSRSTVNRAINDLVDADLVERTDEGYAATTAGRLALEGLQSFRGALGDVVAAEPVTNPLPVDGALDRAAVVGGDARMAAEPNPYRALERFHDDLEEATRYRALLPALDDPRQVRLLYEHVVTEERPADLVVAPEVLDALRVEFPRRAAAMADGEAFSLSVGDVPPFLLALVDREQSGPAVHVVVFNDSGGVHGSVANEHDDAVRWAETLFAERADGADERTHALDPDADGGTPTTVDGGIARAAVGQSLSVALEREGFVRLDVSYFREEPVADPTTAWRAGLTLPEVHTGYAVEREQSGDDEVWAGDEGGQVDEVWAGDEGGQVGENGRTVGDDGRTTLAASLVGDLADGRDCVVLGPPASGKSTVCKRVACDWYDADRGPVLYHQRDRGRTFASVDDLEVTVDAAPGHALVVLEDAVRGDPEAVLEAVRRFRGRDDVSVLLDAREGEWRDATGDSSVATDLAVHHVPPLSDGEWERLVDHFERTVGEQVDVPLERIREEVRAETVGDDDAVRGEVGLALHRLSRYADPLDDGRTSLEVAVATVHDDLLGEDLVDEGATAGDDVAMDVGVLANALNAAGLGVDVDLLYAVAAPDGFEAVDAAIERLEGRVLFPREDGSYRVVHETWSTAFLAHHLETTGEQAAARRFQDCAAALLSLADDPDRREAIAAHRGTTWTPSAVRDDPAEWADETAVALFDLGRTRPKLAPLFGDGTHDGLALPDACSAAVAARRPLWLGRMFADGGHLDRALTAVDRGLEAAPEGSALACRLLGVRSDALADQGAFEDAETAARRQREVAVALQGGGGAPSTESRGRDPQTRERGPQARERDPRTLEAAALARIGAVSRELGEYDVAVEQASEGLDVARAVDARGVAADCLETLGTVATKRGDPGAAVDHFEESLAVRQDVGDRTGAVETLSNLGGAAYDQGDYELARERYRESIALARAVGDRVGEATSLANLALVAHEQSEFADAREQYEAALAIQREVGDREGISTTLGDLGLVARAMGDYEAAREYHEESLAIDREVGDREGEAASLSNLGAVAGRQDDHEAAREYFEQSLAITREMGHRRGQAVTLNNLGLTARNLGEYDDARGYYEESLAVARDIDNPRGEANCLDHLGNVEHELGHYGAAREYHEQSLAIRRELEDSNAVAASLANRGAALCELGDLDAAREHVEEALAIKRDLDHRQGEATTLVDLAVVDRREGDLETAGDRLERAQSLYDDLDEPAGVADARLERARLALVRDELDAARGLAEQAREGFETTGEHHQTARARLVVGRVEVAAGRTGAAREHLRAALETFEAVGAVQDTLAALEHLVAAARDAGDEDALERWCERAARSLGEAPEHLVEEHRTWVEDCADGG